MQKTKNKRRKSNGTDDRSNWSNVNDAGEFGAPTGLLQQSQSNSSKIRGPPSGGFFIVTHYGIPFILNGGHMKKQISVLCMLSISIPALSQTNSLEEISQEVNQLISIHGEKLNNDDKLLVRKNLRQVINVFKVNGYGVPTGGSFICDSNNNQLINLESGKLIFDFSNLENCQEALRNVKMGKSFCDYTDNTLRQASGVFVFDFSDGVNCKEAIESIYKVKKFCDYTDNTLRKFDGSLLYDFSSKEECLKGLL